VPIWHCDDLPVVTNSEVLAHWRAATATHQPRWPDQAALREVLTRLSAAPGLVTPRACDDLRSRLAAVAAGEAFALQGGDCAETFDGATPDAIQGKTKTLLQMAVVLTYAAAMPVVKIGRMAGQYAKPRSSPTETRDGVTLPVYRGDAVNGFDFDAAARVPDPARLWRMYEVSRSTLDIVDSHAHNGYASLDQLHRWNRDFVASSPSGARYEEVAYEIDRALRFMRACGAQPEELRAVEIFASHEGLLLDYEDALTRTDPVTGHDYATSGHMLWIGERTRALDGAHVAYFRSIANPIGIKLGPTTTPAEVQSYMDTLDPDRRPGRLTFITRMGARADPRRTGRGRHAGLDLRSDARQHLRGAQWPQDPALRRHRRRGPRILRGSPRARHTSRRRARGVHRRGRDRMRRRQQRGPGRSPVPPATSRHATRGSTAASPSTSPSMSPNCCDSVAPAPGPGRTPDAWVTCGERTWLQQRILGSHRSTSFMDNAETG
jgi:3-deoxy-7-phosphoheptulonate synthase